MSGPPSVRTVSLARRSDPGRVERLFDLVEEAIRSRAPAQADELLTTLHEHLRSWQPHLLDGVNPLLPGAGAEWEAARAAAYAATARAGAVHLELGTWSAFTDERARELADAAYPVDVVADAAALPFRSGVLDRVASNSVLEPDFLQPGPVRRFRLR